MVRLMKHHWHPPMLGGLWIADIVLLLMIWPVGGPAPVGAILVMWLVPTLALTAATWWWLHRHDRSRHSP